MESAPFQLHSERVGRARELSVNDLARLVWKRIAYVRDQKWLFKGTLQPYRGLTPSEESPSIRDAEEFFTARLRVSGLGYWILRSDEPPLSALSPAKLDLLIDLIELLHAEVVNEPLFVDPPHGLDIEGFDKQAGQAMFRDEINEVLVLAEPQLELLPSGQVIERKQEHRQLYVEPLNPDAEPEVRDPVEHAIGLFLRRGATDEDKRAAIKQLADALEHLRADVREEFLPKDESDLFQIANRFAIRHNNRDQGRDYDKDVWYDWMFHVYLATIRSTTELKQRRTAELDSD